MSMDYDTLTPRDRIGDDLLRKMLSDSERGAEQIPSVQEEPSCQSPRRDPAPEHDRSLQGYPLASVFSPLQSFRQLYDRPTALRNGTLFEELNLPFLGETVYKGGRHCD